MCRVVALGLTGFSILTASVLVSGQQAAAGSLDASQVATGAKWVIHFDAEAMRASDPGKMMQAKWLGSDRAKKKMAEAVEKLGMNPAKDIVDVTLYNDNFKRHRGVVLIQVSKIDGAKALAHLKEKHPDVRKTTYEGQDLFTWKARHPKGDQEYMTSTLFDDSTIVMSSEMTKVMDALDVLSGRKESLSPAAPLGAAAPAGSIIVMRAIDMAGADLPGKCPVLKQSESFSFVGGQDGEKLFATTVLTGQNEGVAKNSAAVIEGFRAMMSLKAMSDAEMMPLVAGLSTNVDGKTVTIDWRIKSADAMKAMAKMKKKWHGKHGKHGWWKKHGHRKHWHKKHHDEAGSDKKNRDA